MMNVVRYKKWYFLFSLLLIIPGLLSLALYGLRLSIDFTGGTRISYLSESSVSRETAEDVERTIEEQGVNVSSFQISERELILRTDPMTEKDASATATTIKEDFPELTQNAFETIGPTIGNETTRNALLALGLASLLIILYIAWSFRKVPHPTSSWKFGVTTIVTLVHDVLVLVGIFSILGYFLGVEVDSLFLTALLTVMGFSVHDTIVVFDRIRENLLKSKQANFARVVNDSILQTLSRSLNTSFTALLVLLALLLFGGESMRWFVVALLIGIASGTYSSIFNAAQLLVLWDEWDRKLQRKK